MEPLITIKKSRIRETPNLSTDADSSIDQIVPCGKFHRIRGAPPETLPSEKYDAPEKVGGDRKSFDSPIRK